MRRVASDVFWIAQEFLHIPAESLVQCLRRLEKSGFVKRRVLTTGRLGVKYAFTELGRTLERPVASLFEWTTEYADVVRAAQVAFDAIAGDERDAA
jgi:DNA-binding HxlR family transcriptional regulator